MSLSTTYKHTFPPPPHTYTCSHGSTACIALWDRGACPTFPGCPSAIPDGGFSGLPPSTKALAVSWRNQCKALSVSSTWWYVCEWQTVVCVWWNSAYAQRWEYTEGCMEVWGNLEELMRATKSWIIGKDPDAEKDWGQKRGDRGWDGWMASLTQWTWVWVNSRRWRRTGKPGTVQGVAKSQMWLNYRTTRRAALPHSDHCRHTLFRATQTHSLFPVHTHQASGSTEVRTRSA